MSSEHKRQELNIQAHIEQERWVEYSIKYPDQTYSIGDNVIYINKNGFAEFCVIVGLNIINDGESLSYNFDVVMIDDVTRTAQTVPWYRITPNLED
jgi:hypothetical protein